MTCAKQEEFSIRIDAAKKIGMIHKSDPPCFRSAYDRKKGAVKNLKGA